LSGLGCRAPALVFLSLLLLAGTACDAARRVVIPLNGESLEALYWEPAKRLSPAVLLAAPAGQPKESWVSLGTRLRKQGYGVLALELSAGEPASNELRAAFEWMRLRKKVDAARIGIVGGGEAADAALEFAAREPLVRTVVLLLPESPHEERKPLLRQYGYRARLVTEARMVAPGAALIHPAQHERRDQHHQHRLQHLKGNPARRIHRTNTSRAMSVRKL